MIDALDSPKFWEELANATTLVSEGLRRVEGDYGDAKFRVYRVPEGPIRIDIQPQEESRG